MSPDPSQPTTTRTIDVFISHASEDLSEAEAVVAVLERAGWSVFLAARDLPAVMSGAHWGQRIDEALELCGVLILLVSPEALTKRWVQYEWRAFHNNVLSGRAVSVIPLCVRETSPAALRLPLQQYQAVDLRSAEARERGLSSMLVQLESHLGRAIKARDAQSGCLNEGRTANPGQDLTLPSADQHTSVRRDVLRVHCLEMAQSVVANVIAGDLGLTDRLTGFKFNEETGDLTDRGSYLELVDGTRVTLTFWALHEALDKASQKVAAPFLARGFSITDCVVQGFKERWGKNHEALAPDVPILVLVEKLTRPLSKCAEDELADALERYAYDLPTDLDRSFLNAMPSPSPSKEILEELVARGAWSALKDTFTGVASLEPGIVVFWMFQIIQMRDRIKDEQVLAQIRKVQPKDPKHLRPWAEKLAEFWFGIKQRPR